MLCDLVEDEQVQQLYVGPSYYYYTELAGNMLSVLASDWTDTVCRLHS